MELTWMTIAVISAAFFLAGIIDAVSGGGGLLTLPTFLLLGFPVHLIAGTNQCSCCAGSLISLGRFAKSGRIYWKTAAIAAPVSLLGSILGARLNLIIPERYLQIVMIVILPIAATVLLLKRDFGLENRADELTRAQQIAVALFIGLVWGTYIGFYGAGGGTFILLSFALLNKLDLITASGNTKVCSSVASVSAAVTYACSGAVVWQVVLPAALLNLLGNYIGAGLALHKGAKVIRPMFLVVLLMLLVRLTVSLFF